MPVSRSSSPENDVFAIHDTIAPVREQKAAGTALIDFDGLLDPALIIYEDLKEGCGGQLWPAGMVLARYMLTHHKRNLQDKYILEIGAGGGLVGLAVALGCDVTKQIHITDQEPMLQLMQRNIASNVLSSKARAYVYDWASEPIPEFPSTSGHCDVLLAADCVYFEPAFPLLLQTLQDLIGPQTECFFCFKKRRKADARFIKDMKKTFKVIQIEYDGRDRDRADSIFLYKLSKKSTAQDEHMHGPDDLHDRLGA